MKFEMKAMHLAVVQVLGAGAMLAVGPAAMAQDATNQKLEKVEITGSNIKRTDAEGVSPVQTITKEEIERSGQSTVAELLRGISANSGNSYNETFTNSFSPGASGISLRGLSQKNTLVLLNGRRVANYGYAQNLQDTYVDLNTIPANAVERIEILKDGASAVYGSDAIAGVVNVILRKDYKGAEVGGSYGVDNYGGMAEKNLNGVIGFGDLGKDRYNVMVAANYFKRDLVDGTQRPYTKEQDWRDHVGQGGLLSRATSGSYVTSPIANYPGATATTTPFPTCGTSIPGSTSPLYTGCRYNPAAYITLFPSSERYQVVSSGTLNISPTLTAFGDFIYSENKSYQKFSPGQIASTSVVYNPATGGVSRVSNQLPVGNPSNPYARPVGITYSFFDVGPRDSSIKSDFYRFNAGLKGQLGNWDWEAAYGHSESKTDTVAKNRIDALVLAQDIANGSYSFLNPASTPAETARLRINPVRSSTSKLDSVDAKATSELYQLPAGPLGFAAGVDLRRESINDNPDTLLTTGHVLGQGATATSGSRDNDALYAEFSIPVIKNVELSLAGRQDHYSDFGDAFSPKAGIRFQPVPELVLRATASKGFRAPSLPEISKSSATFFTSVNDPGAGGALTNIAGVFAGNPNLKAEHSENFNAGFVLSPTADTSFGIDYYKIRQKDIVSSNGFQFIVNNPALFPGQILRDPVTGALVAVTDGYKNLSLLKTSGYDVDFSQTIRSSVGKFTLSGTWTYLQSYKTAPAVGEDLQEYVGGNAYTALPRVRGVTRLDWDTGPWATTLSANYTHHYYQQSVGGQTEVASNLTFDLYTSYSGFKNIKLTATIINVANKVPPWDAYFPAAGYGIPYDFTLYDARGRYFRAGAKYTF